MLNGKKIVVVIGLLRVDLGRYDDALLSYSKALQIRPTTGIVYSNMAVAFSKKGNTDQAEKHLQRAVELSGKTLAAKLSHIGTIHLAKRLRRRRK